MRWDELINSMTAEQFEELRYAVEMRAGPCGVVCTLTAEELLMDKIEAIKAVRLRLNLGLKQAKDVVERYSTTPSHRRL